MDTENLGNAVGWLLRFYPIVAIGTEIAVYHHRALVPYGKHEIAVYERPDAVAKRKERIEEALRYGVRFDYKGMEERAQGQQDPEGITETVQEMYRDLEIAVEEGEYEEIEANAESLIGIARSTIEHNHLLNGLLREVIETVKKGYDAYVRKAEGEEYKIRKKGDTQRADYLLECITDAEERVSELEEFLATVR